MAGGGTFLSSQKVLLGRAGLLPLLISVQVLFSGNIPRGGPETADRAQNDTWGPNCLYVES